MPRRLRWLCLLAVAVAAPLPAATITVTSNADTVAVDGGVTLREAITSINNGANVNADVVPAGAYGTNDTINFAVAACNSGCSIALTSALPAITTPVLLDGYTQSGAAVNSLAVGDNAVIQILVDGTGAGAGVDGFVLTNHSGSTVRGLAVGNMSRNGILISGTGGGHTISGMFVGTNRAGTAKTTIGNNGVEVNGVAGNLIGLPTLAGRNVIAGNGLSNRGSIDVEQAGATGNVVANNYVDVNAAGTTSLASTGFGVIVFATSGNSIGQAVANGGNVISGGGGLSLQDTSNNTIVGNLIGTDATGTAALPNTFGGVAIIGTSSGNVVGGTSALARNVISGNSQDGVLLGGCGGSNTTVQGNFIGTDISGTLALVNTRDGIRIDVDHHNALIGGNVAVGSGNLIAFNQGNGIGINDDNFCGPIAINNAILSNSIHDNGLKGINLTVGTNAPLANDAGDADAGVNHLQNYPVLTAATTSGAGDAVQGTLNGAVATTYTIQFFVNAACSATGAGEGALFVGGTTVTTDGAGNANVGTAFAAGTLPLGQVVTATATDPNANTSEFSACRVVTAAPPPPPPSPVVPVPASGPAGLALLVLALLAATAFARRR